MQRLVAGILAAMLGGCAVPVAPNAEESERMRQAAVLAYESGEAARAETLYQGLARATPSDPETWFRLGNLYARANRPEDAATAYQKSLQLNPNDARAWYNLAVVRQRQAYALFLQANSLTDKSDPLFERSETMLHRLEPQSPAEPAAMEKAPIGKTPAAAGNGESGEQGAGRKP